jgi:2-keto-4-pentenoate hydratase/2-oxohepta-3-ene-1,7-dioic acid hydratase in catechol pathway
VIWRDEQWVGITNPLSDSFDLTGDAFGTNVTLLAPCRPRVILGMAHNGPGDRPLPPQAFMKSPRTAVGPGDPIRIDPMLGAVNVEGELAVVMRRTVRHLQPDDVADAVLGFTIGNDVTAIDQIPLDEKMTQVKNGDGFTPLGPWISTGVDWWDVNIDVSVNGEHRAHGNTADLAYNVVEILVYLSSIMTLGPGDVILTGAPRTSTRVEPGDHVAISLAGLGTLENPVAHHSRNLTSKYQEHQ